MGGVLEKLLEKARKEPEKYRDLLLEEKRSLEADLRHYFTWSLAILSLEIAYIGVIRVIEVKIMVMHLLVIILMTTIIMYLTIQHHDRERILDEIRRILYGDPMDKRDSYFLIYVAIMSVILAILAIIL